MLVLAWLLLSFVWHHHLADGSAIDNGVVGLPRVVCTDEGVGINVDVKNPFTGRIFVKDEAHRAECSTSERNTFDTVAPRLAVLFEQCGMFRERQANGSIRLNPRGMMYSLTVIVSFHPLFVTKVDRAYQLKCFYGEVTRTVTESLDISMIPTEPLTAASDMPSCTYSIRGNTVDGPAIRFANVGDKVVHRWECDTNMYKFLVKNCLVEDGRTSEKVTVIDNNGCSVDTILLSDIRYDANRPIAFAESHQFKFADISKLYFTCQLQVCPQMDASCNAITPPNCASVSPGVPPGYISLREFQQLQRQGRADQQQPPIPHTPPHASQTFDGSAKRQAVTVNYSTANKLPPPSTPAAAYPYYSFSFDDPPGRAKQTSRRRSRTRRGSELSSVDQNNNNGRLQNLNQADDEQKDDESIVDVRTEQVTVFDIDRPLPLGGPFAQHQPSDHDPSSPAPMFNLIRSSSGGNGSSEQREAFINAYPPPQQQQPIRPVNAPTTHQQQQQQCGLATGLWLLLVLLIGTCLAVTAVSLFFVFRYRRQLDAFELSQTRAYQDLQRNRKLIVTDPTKSSFP